MWSLSPKGCADPHETDLYTTCLMHITSEDHINLFTQMATNNAMLSHPSRKINIVSMMQGHHHRGQPRLPPQTLRQGLQGCSPLLAPAKPAISQPCHLLLLQLLQLPEVLPAKALRVRPLQLAQQLLGQLLLLG